MIQVLFAIVSIIATASAFGLWRNRAALEAQLRETLAARAAAEATLAQLDEQLHQARDDAAHANKALVQANMQEALALQKVEATEQRLREFEQTKTQFEQYAKSAALAAGNELSNKLLDDHKRAREETHKQFEQFTKAATETLTKKQQELAVTLGNVQAKQLNDSAQISTLVRAMQNPIGAGAEGEIVMNNILQQHGFTPSVDYELQVHLAGEDGNLRPDCVVYLPHNHAILVDAKASQHILALFRVEEGTAEFDSVFHELKATMRAHAKALASKSYQDSLKKLKNHYDQPITRTTLVMFVPNDEVVIRLAHKDPNLMQYLREHDIVLAGPNTLSGLFLTARALIREARQQDEHHAIMELTSELMADFITSLSYAEDVMKGISNSAKAYDKFGGSLRNALSKMRKIANKGVRPAKNKAIPSGIARYSIHREDDVVQGEAEEVAELLRIPKDAA